MSNTRRIVIADDHPLFRSALRATLESQFADIEILEAEDFQSLQTCMETNRDVALVLLDLQMPGTLGFSALVFLLAHYPTAPVMIVSAHDEAEIIRRAIDHGASGFLPKSAAADTMQQALSNVMEGGCWLPQDYSEEEATSAEEISVADALGQLTPQQFRVAGMLCQGLLNKQIAYELNVTEATIKAHMTEIFRKLGVQSRTQAAVALNQLAVFKDGDQQQFKIN